MCHDFVMIFVCPASTSSAATGPESVSQLLEPAISGITAVVSADSAVRNAAVSSELANAAASQQQPIWPLG